MPKRTTTTPCGQLFAQINELGSAATHRLTGPLNFRAGFVAVVDTCLFGSQNACYVNQLQ